TAGHLRGLQSVNLQLGQTVVPVTQASFLTPAERIAVSQILRTGNQSLQLNLAGGAVGGSLVLRGGLSRAISNLVIPQGVTVLENAGRSGGLALSGNLTNAGNLYLFSTNPTVSVASVRASNIFNQAGAVISTSLPSNLLPGSIKTIDGLNLRLSAAGDIINA